MDLNPEPDPDPAKIEKITIFVLYLFSIKNIFLHKMIGFVIHGVNIKHKGIILIKNV